MNKKLIALALASAFVAPAAMAADGVTLYGVMGVSVDSVKGDGTFNAATTPTGGERRTRVSSDNSRFGFKGVEELNSDLAAIWQLEYAVQMDQQNYSQPQGSNDSQGTVSLRNTFVGLRSQNMGTLTLGTQDSPLKTSTSPLGVFNDTLADYRSVFTKLSTRSDNSILYSTPSLGGLTGNVMYGQRNEAGNGSNSNPRMRAASLVYQGGPFYGTVAYEDNKIAPSILSNSSYDDKAWRAGFGFNFSNTKLGLAYEKNKRDGIPAGAMFLGSAAGGANDGHAWYGSVSQKIGSITLAASYTLRSEYTDGANNGAKQYTGGVSYDLSKRTSLYGLYTKVANDDNGTNGLGPATGIATVSTIAGGDASGFSLGVVHKF